MTLIEGLAWAAVYSVAVLAPFVVGVAVADERFRRKAIRQWHHEGHERHPRD